MQENLRKHQKNYLINFFIFFDFYIDTFFYLIYIFYINARRWLFPDCVMVAPQILVLIVGVRILLGEIELAYYWSVLFFLKSAASNIGLVRRPLKAERRVRLPLWLEPGSYESGCFFIRTGELHVKYLYCLHSF